MGWSRRAGAGWNALWTEEDQALAAAEAFALMDNWRILQDTSSAVCYLCANSDKNGEPNASNRARKRQPPSLPPSAKNINRGLL